VRDMLADEVRLELVNKSSLDGRREVSRYFTNYSKIDDWRLALGFVDRRPAVIVRDPADPSGKPAYFVLLGWTGDSVATIRDFLARNEKLAAEKLVSEVEILHHQLDVAESEKDLNVAQRTVQQVTLQHQQLESERSRQRTEEESELEKVKVRIEALHRQAENCSGDLMSIRAPYHGMVISLSHRNAGGVVHNGDELCQLARMEGDARARLLVREQGLPRLAPGQKVRLFFEAFPYQRYGTATGNLEWISSAAVSSSDGSTFIARAVLDQNSFSSHGHGHPLRVGMKGEARIVVGSRTLIEYAFEPIRQLREQTQH